MKDMTSSLKAAVVGGITGRRDGMHTYLLAKCPPRETGRGNGWRLLLSAK